MSKFIKTGLVISGIILFGAGCARGAKDYAAPTAQAPDTGANAVAEGSVPTPEAVIEYTDEGFNPSTLRVLAGTKVTFVNKGAKAVWPASGVHPTHDICPGFDAGKTLAAGESYSYVFEQEAECPFHNHVAPGEKGAIEVKVAK
ncbi:hypothetical protein HYW17_00050 [Candidatus Uhrbacteria bacterium]|nr:hypothetical protein [Candidatus Uhrbacteria bacterium]